MIEACAQECNVQAYHINIRGLNRWELFKLGAISCKVYAAQLVANIYDHQQPTEQHNFEPSATS